MPLEFKKGGSDVSKKDSTSSSNDNNVASSSSADEGDTGSKVESSTPTSEKVQSATTSDKSVDADSAAGAAGSFTPSADTPLANKYYLKKMQMAQEVSKNSETREEEKSLVAETIEAPATPVPVPVTAPRRRFADFGIASEVAEPTGQDLGTSASDGESTSTATTTKLGGFSDISRPSKQTTETESIEGNEQNTANPLRDNNNKPTAPESTKDDTAGKIQDAKAALDTETKSPATSTIKEEKKATDPTATASSSAIKKEEENSASPAAAAESTTIKDKGTTAPASPTATCSITDNNQECTPITTKSSELVQTTQQSSSPFSKLLIQIQPLKNELTLPNFSNLNNLNPEDFGILPLVIIGISVYLALGVYLKQVNDTDDGYAGWDELGNRKKLEKSDDDNVEKEEKGGPLALIQKVKDAGTAGAISYALWEAAFWGVSIPVCLVGFRQATGHWPDLTLTSSGIGGEDVKQVGGAAFAFVNVARLAVPVRIGLALSTVPWVEENIVGKFGSKKEDDDEQEEELLTGEIEDEDTSAISEVEERLNKMETQASRISSKTLQKMNAGIDPTLLEYCEPGQVNDDCADSILGYLDSLASTGAVATDGEVRSIVGYLDSLSSNVSTPNENAGAAFTSYLDAVSTGFIPAPSSAKAVASYLDVLSSTSTAGDDATTATFTPPPLETATAGEGAALPKEQKIGSRINEVEERLSRLESSVTSLPDDIASRLVDWQISQDKKMSDEMEKIMKLLVDGESLEK